MSTFGFAVHTQAKAAEIEGENERQKVIIRQKEQEINDTIKVTELYSSCCVQHFSYLFCPVCICGNYHASGLRHHISLVVVGLLQTPEDDLRSAGAACGWKMS